MKKRWTALLTAMAIIILCCNPALAASVPQEDTAEYKVAFYAFDCYNMEDENGRKYGYGYDMMQGISKYLQCTFSYVGYDKTAKECEEMLRDGSLDIYTAAKKTPEREQEFAFSSHPAITAQTCMNVKRGNTKVVAGDYSTYNGLKIGLLKRHTYNDRVIAFMDEHDVDCEILYYETPTELSNALVDGQVDALVNSYIRIPEDEMTVEDFGETPYYFMVRKADSFLVDEIDAAIDEMNIETPNWRSDLYNEYYGTQNSNTKLTSAEEELLAQMRQNHTKVRAVMRTDRNPYSWFEKGEGRGIAADVFALTAEKLGLEYEIVPVSSKDEYEELLSSGTIDVCLDMESYYEDEGSSKYKLTNPYLTTSVSILRQRGSSGKKNRIGIVDDSIAIREIITNAWPTAEVIVLDTPKACIRAIMDDEIDGALMMSYSAQKLARDDTQNRFSVDIVPGATLQLQMGVRATCSRYFYGMWEKTLAEVAANNSTEIVQNYLETTSTPTLIAYLFDHPAYLLIVVGLLCLILFIVILFVQSTRAKNRQMEISAQLSEALTEARKANDAKFNFFSKMSHDIRTPMNAVLGMTQIAKKYKNDSGKLDHALDSISSEGNYLLTMINSILDINQLEHGHVELVYKAFDIGASMQESMSILQPLAAKKEQKMQIHTDCMGQVVVGDVGRFSQIMVNIVSNAIKYTEAGGAIQVSLEKLPENRYRFTCTDNGIGMSKEYIAHICEDYSRAEDSRTSATEGTGLGMSVVKGFTELMHGTLVVTSELGKGSTFVVEIPFEEASTEARDAILHAADGEEQASMNLAGKHVLLVEDNALNAEIATELMESIGMLVDWAENGAVGVEKFEQSIPYTYSAIFMDMQMPVMDGIEATRQIRALHREDNGVLIFAMTANTLAKDRRECEAAGMNGYISKPINLKEIVDTVQEKSF